MQQLLPVALAAILALTFASRPAWSQEFRVDSRVFVVGQSEPVSTSQTYFTKDIICDIAADGQATLIHRKTESVTIVDPKRRLRCEISADELFRAIAAITARVADKPPVVRFAAAPNFESTWSEDENKLQMTGGPLSYTVETLVPESTSASAAYQQFADWLARLNATQPGGLPPQARLLLNAQLRSVARVPTRVSRKCSHLPNHFFSTHTYGWALDDRDHARIDERKRQAKEFQAVTLVNLRISKVDARIRKR